MIVKATKNNSASQLQKNKQTKSAIKSKRFTIHRVGDQIDPWKVQFFSIVDGVSTKHDALENFQQ